MVPDTFYYKANIIYIIFIIVSFCIKQVENGVDSYFKTLYLSENNYFIVTFEKIYYFNSASESLSIPYTFTTEQQLKTEDDSKMINFGKFKYNEDVQNLLVVKNYIYSFIDGTYQCNQAISEIENYISEIYPFKCNTYCYYILGIINSSKQLILYLYKKSPNSCDSNLVNTFIINNIGSDNFSCQIMNSPDNGEVFTCFYENNSNQLMAKSLNINMTNEIFEEITSLDNSKSNNGASIIKSMISSQDETKSFICYINSESNCDCLTYCITSNQWNDYSTYINSCLSNVISLFFDYYEISDEYFLYCYQSSSKIYILKLNENLGIINRYSNDTYEEVKNCSVYFFSSIIYNTKSITAFRTCDNILLASYLGQFPELPTTIFELITTLPTTIAEKIVTTIIIAPSSIITTIIQSPTTLPIISSILTQDILPKSIISSNPLNPTNSINLSPANSQLTNALLITDSIPSSLINFSPPSSILKNELTDNIKNDYNVIQKNIFQTKEEIIANLDNFINDFDLNEIYELFGSDFNIKISPINEDLYKNISTYINFYNCYNILIDSNNVSESDILTVFQIEIYNQDEQILINNVEYAVFKNNKERLDLSKCKNELIEINYQLNTSLINMTKASYYADLGINIFNIEDDFFNDICYSYSEYDSDIILKDRISDIYENYSLCENNCEMDKINFTDNTVSCKCSIKNNISSEVEKPSLKQIIRDSFVDTNLAVIKCYNLVFSFKNKLKNIGFWIFSVLIIIHIPLFVYYFIFKISSIRIFIYSELNKYHYLYNVKNCTPKKNNNSNKRIEFKKEKKKNNDKKSSALRILKNKNNFNKNINFKTIATKRIKASSNINTRNLLLTKEKYNKLNKKNKINEGKKNTLFVINKIINKNYITIGSKKNLQNSNKDSIKRGISEKTKYFLIQIDANNESNTKPKNSDIILDNYDYTQAIKYEKRHFCKIFFICILAKENIINIFLFRTQLEITPLRICLFIFSFSCDLALNTIFYSNDSISDKYHYTGKSIFLFSLLNNFLQSILSSIVGLILVNIFQFMIDFRGDLEDIFREKEKKLRKNKDYKVDKKEKKNIWMRIKKISSKLAYKIIIFIISEFLIMLFFYYFVTAFCEVYLKTQISWLYDFFISFLISFPTEISFAFFIALFYCISVKYKIKILYRIIMFLYSL